MILDLSGSVDRVVFIKSGQASVLEMECSANKMFYWSIKGGLGPVDVIFMFIK